MKKYSGIIAIILVLSLVLLSGCGSDKLKGRKAKENYNLAVTDIASGDFAGAESALEVIEYEDSDSMLAFVSCMTGLENYSASALKTDLEAVTEIENEEVMTVYTDVCDEVDKVITLQSTVDGIDLTLVEENDADELSRLRTQVSAIDYGLDCLIDTGTIDRAEKVIENIKNETEAGKTMMLIREIGDVTLKSEKKINKANDAYNELGEAEQEEVENLSVLTDAMAALDARKAERDEAISVLDDEVQNVDAKKTSKGVKVTWSAVAGATGYKVYRATKKNGKYKLLKTLDSESKTSFTNKKTLSGKKYYYKVKSYVEFDDKIYKSDFSASDSVVTKPGKPQNVSITGKSTDSLTVSWSKVPRADGYKIYRASSKDGNYKIVKTVHSGSTTSWKDTGLKSNSTKYYKVKAFVEYGEHWYAGNYSGRTHATTNKKVTHSSNSGNSGGGTVYITDTGDCYHNSWCSSLRYSKHAVSLSYAKQYYRPCQRCH